MHSGRRVGTLCICLPSRRSTNVSAPSGERGSTGSNRRATPASAPESAARGEILKNEAGTPNRLLVVLSDGFPYDDGYEGRYAEADADKAFEELRTEGVACLCLSIGAETAADALERVFGSASHASAATLAELSPQMDRLFMLSRCELAAPSALSARVGPARAGR